MIDLAYINLLLCKKLPVNLILLSWIVVFYKMFYSAGFTIVLGNLPANFFLTMDFCLCGAILNLKAFCFGVIPDIIIELTACVGLPGLSPSGPK
jgi:hypothetical protein